jgi:AcrR family transcriptional regulator
VAGVLDPTIPTDIGEQAQRSRIIEAMIACCAEKTYASTTIADIVKRASISRTTFYKRFANKRACFDGAVDACVEALRAAAVGTHTSADAPARRVRIAAAAMLELMATRPDLAQLTMGDALTVEPALVNRYRELLIPPLQKLWASAGEPGLVHTDPLLAFGRAQVLVFNQIASGRTARLPELLPEIVYLALLPFVGHEEAVREAREIESDGAAQ